MQEIVLNLALIGQEAAFPEEGSPDSGAGPGSPEWAGVGGQGWTDAPGPIPTHSDPLQGSTGPASLVWDLLAGSWVVPRYSPSWYPPRIPTLVYPPGPYTLPARYTEVPVML